MMAKPILVLDFDGVCHSYTTPWQATDIIPDPPVPGMWRFLEKAFHHFDVHIFSSRSCTPEGLAAMRRWFITHAESGFQHDLVHKWLQFPTSKPPAFLTLDDRGLTFTGTWPEIDTLLAFQPWNKSRVPSPPA